MKKCTGPCGQEKADDQFYASSPNKCKACVLKRQKELKDAAAGGKAATQTTIKGGGSRKSSGSKKAAGKPVHTPNATWIRPSGFGFEVSLQVDADKAQTDILIKQHGTELGEQTVWLNQAEARELHSWLTEQLGG